MSSHDAQANDYISIGSTNTLKGIFAVFVLVHHLYQYSGLLHGTIAGELLENLGFLSVGMFFFYTGYGMKMSAKKHGYVKSIGRRRILPLYVIYILLIVLYGIWMTVLRYPISFGAVFQSFLFGGTIVPLGWYLQASFVLYLILWLAFSVADSDWKCLSFTFVLLSGYCLICELSGLSSKWYESIFCVLVGMFWSAGKEKIDLILGRKKWAIFIASLILFTACLTCVLFSSFFHIGFKILSAITFAVFVTVLTNALPRMIYHNRVAEWLGRYSFEIYVCQGFFLLLRKDGIIYIVDPYVFILIASVGTMILAIIIKPVFDMMNSAVKRNYNS